MTTTETTLNGEAPKKRGRPKKNAEPNPEWDAAAAASAETARKEDVTKLRTFTKELPCKLNDADILERNRIMIDLMAKKAEVEDAKKVATGSFTQQIKEIDKKLREIAADCRKREETRKVECTEEANYALGIMRTIRGDTMEEVSKRALLSNERQATLPLEKGGAVPPERVSTVASRAQAELPTGEDEAPESSDFDIEPGSDGELPTDEEGPAA